MTYRARIEEQKTNNPLEEQFMELQRKKDPYFDHPSEDSIEEDYYEGDYDEGDYDEDYDETNYDPYSGQDSFERDYIDDFPEGCEYG